MSWDEIYEELFGLLTHSQTGLNSLLIQRGLAPIQLFAREELTRDITPALILRWDGARLSPLSSVVEEHYTASFPLELILREATPTQRGRETRARKYLDALGDFLAGKRVKGCPIRITEVSIEYPDPTHTIARVGIEVNQ